MSRGTISTYESGVDLIVEWKIEDFFNLPEMVSKWYWSPDFSFGGERWCLKIFPNKSSGSDSSGHVNLELWKCGSDRPTKQSFSLSLKTAKGEKYNEQNVTKDFEERWDYHSFNRFIQRSDLARRRYELVPDGVLMVVCTMKSSTSAGSASNTASTSDKCCHCKITFNAQNLSSHQKRCMHRPIKCPGCLEVVVLQKWLDEHECQKERSEDYNCREKLLMFLCIASILIAVVTGCILAYSKTPLSSTHPCGDLVMSNEQLQEKTAHLKAVAETLKARESELNAIKKEHGELKSTCYESIAREKNKLKHCLDSEKQNCVQLKKEMKEKQSQIDSITKELRKKETDFNDFKNKNEKLILKIKEIESEKKLLEEKATENKNLVMSNEQLQEKTAQLKAVAETLKARESELNAIKKEHGELKSTCYESIASEKNKLQHCLDSEKQKPLPQPVLMVTEVGSTYLEVVWVLPEESKTNAAHILHYIVYFRKYEAQWQEVAFPDASRTSYSLTNLDPGMSYQIYVMAVDSSGFSRTSENAIVRTSNKVIYHNSSKDHRKELAATIIIFIIAIACVYVYSKTSLSVQHPYEEGTQTISAEDNIIKADLSEVAETDEPEASDSKTCATETEGPITFNNPPEDSRFLTDINHLLEENRGIDVTFELETPNGKTKLFSHKLILAVMSSYFADEFYDKGRNKGHQVIPLKGIDPKAFEQMIRYCYGEKLSLRTIEDACALFKIASKFKVISLQNLCHTFFRHTKIEPGNVFSILKISVEMEDQSLQDLQDMCNKILQERTREVMSAYDLCDVTPAMVYTLLNLPKLSLNSEYELINWIFDWAKLKSEDENLSCRSTRDYLAKLLRNMNFLALTVKEFVMLTRDNPKFFNSDEIVSVSMNIVIPGTREMPVWHNKDLKSRVYTGSNE